MNIPNISRSTELFDITTCINVKVNPNAKKMRDTLIIVMCKSESMIGSLFKHIKLAILDMIYTLINTHDIYLIAYSDLVFDTHIKQYKPDVDIFDFREKTTDEISGIINSIKLNNNLVYGVAFDAIGHIVSKLMGKPFVSIIFMADNKNTKHKAYDEMQKDLVKYDIALTYDKLQKNLIQYANNYKIYCVGITNKYEHDNMLSISTTKRNHFVHIESSLDAKKKMKYVCSLIGKIQFIKVKINDVTSTVEVINGNGKLFTNESLDTIKIITDDDSYISFVQNSQDTYYDTMYNTIQYIRMHAKQIIRKLYQSDDSAEIFNAINILCRKTKLLYSEIQCINIRTIKKKLILMYDNINNITSKVQKFIINYINDDVDGSKMINVKTSLFNEYPYEASYSNIENMVNEYKKDGVAISKKMQDIRCSKTNNNIYQLLLQGEFLCVKLEHVAGKVCLTYISSGEFICTNQGSELDDIFPLYLFEEHWKMIKEFEEEFETNLSPITILDKVMRGDDNMMQQLVLKTCQVIIEELKYDDDIQEKYDAMCNYKIVTENNIKESLGVIYIGQTLNIIPFLDDIGYKAFAATVAEEMIRRSLTNVPETGLSDYLISKIFDYSIDASSIDTFKITKFTDHANAIIVTILEQYEKVKKKLNFLKFMGSGDCTIELIDLGLDTHEKLLAFTLQIYCHNDDNKRKEAFANNTHYNTFIQDEAVTYLHKLLMENYNARATLFGNADNLHDASIYLKGIYTQDIKYFANVLQEKECPCAFEKIKLLIDGYYNGTQLYIDRHQVKNCGWTPSKKNCFRFWKMNNKMADPSEWVKLFDDANCKASVSSWYNKEL